MHVGLVTQDTTLFSGTIAENIGYRDLMTNIDMKTVKVAAHTANAVEFIETLSEGYETNIGPRGSLLSGGQRQRLAIARALYQNPSILVLDEATSALDLRSEMLVREALQLLLKNPTVIVIAHRLETVLMAERVFGVNDGKLQDILPSSLRLLSIIRWHQMGVSYSSNIISPKKTSQFCTNCRVLSKLFFLIISLRLEHLD